MRCCKNIVRTFIVCDPMVIQEVVANGLEHLTSSIGSAGPSRLSEFSGRGAFRAGIRSDY
jgi:hypothetical protein